MSKVDCSLPHLRTETTSDLFRSQINFHIHQKRFALGLAASAVAVTWSIRASVASRGRLRSGLRVLTHTGVGVFLPTLQTWNAQGFEWWSQLTWQAVTINRSSLIKILCEELYLTARGAFHRKRRLVPYDGVKLRSATLCRNPHRSPESVLSFCGECRLRLWKNSSGKHLWWQAVICLW